MGSALESLFDETDSMDCLNQAIDSKKQAVDLIPVNHQQRATFLDGYGGLLQVRFERSGSMDDLNEAITAVEEAIRLTPERTSKTCMYHNLSIALRSRFKQTSFFGDLERAVAVAKLAVESDADDPNRRYHLNGLGIALDMQFEWTGSLEFLNEGIMYMEEALQLTPDDDSLRPKFLHDLSLSLNQRFKHAGSMTDVEAAIEYSNEAVRLSCNPFTRAYCLNGLGLVLRSRIYRKMERDNLIAAVKAFMEAVELTPDDDEERMAARLTNAGTSLHILYQVTQSMEHLTMAIEAAEDALQLTPKDHIDRAGRLNNLGNSLEDRFLQTGDIGDLEAAIKCQQEAVELTSPDYPDRAIYLGNLANSLLLLYQTTDDQDKYHRAIAVREEAVSVSSAAPNVRILYARLASTQLMAHDVQRTYLLLKKAIELLPKVSPRNLSWRDSQHAISQFPGLASDTAAAALASGSPPLEAVQMLDSGRLIILGHLLDVRSDLQGVPDDLFERFQMLRSLLDGTHDANQSESRSINHLSCLHQAALDFESLQQEIRLIDGCEYFGLPLPEFELRKQASLGPIIFLNVSLLRSDAIIVGKDGITCLALPEVDIKQALQKVGLFQTAVKEITKPMKSKNQKSRLVKKMGPDSD
jgi:tetratricopeptide (TPR) repeat protein